MFSGSYVALVTPFRKEGGVDEQALERLVSWHIRCGMTGIVPCGTTGESATLSHEEHEEVIRSVVRAAKLKPPLHYKGKIQVIAGTGSNATEESVRLTKSAEEAGVDGALLIAPYYNRPTQKGLYLHFREVAKSVSIPLVLYNIPSRTGVNVEPETVARLARDCKNIVSIKEASGNLEQMSRILSLCPKGFTLLSGDDALTLPVMALGGAGVISVAANIVPRAIVSLVEAVRGGKLKTAQRRNRRLLPLVKALFLETNPIPVKTAMGMMNLCGPGFRLPICGMSPRPRARLRRALLDFGLI